MLFLQGIDLANYSSLESIYFGVQIQFLLLVANSLNLLDKAFSLYDHFE